ncbi:hypothetical protein D0Z07_8292 [Hyphodiscus hymeniophilus]|uniref:Uncharacterized protein n=1 Tax=Hyphodiscus hymeniophilus TaxID=353542 RepID=A0A9P6SL50_9HELO|nr:hypothetical protein D0Z07_8292 [Hyphodiscus hymeniophilus]
MAISTHSLATRRPGSIHVEKVKLDSTLEGHTVAMHKESKMDALKNRHVANGTTTAPIKGSFDTSAPSTAASSDVTAVDFTGDVNTNNDLPSQAILKSVADMPLLDKDGKVVPFKNLYSGTNGTRRVLVIFIRHFFCGNCQEFLRTLTDSISTAELLRLPTPTFIAVVGHGSHSLIPMYANVTHCPFPIYADPTKHLYNALGMVRTLNMGTRPEYQRRGTVKGMWQSVVQGISNLKGGKALQGLDWHQVGGEFLFEPIDMSTPITSPEFEVNKQLNGAFPRDGYVEEKQVTWCHRMKNTRDHAELPELREILGLDGAGKPGKDIKRWTKAMGERKGTGFSARTSVSMTRNGGSSGRQSVSVERENAAKTLNGESTGQKSVAEERERAAAALNGEVMEPLAREEGTK